MEISGHGTLKVGEAGRDYVVFRSITDSLGIKGVVKRNFQEIIYTHYINPRLTDVQYKIMLFVISTPEVFIHWKYGKQSVKRIP